VTLANDICTAINNNTAISGYSASNVNGLVTVSSTTGGVAMNGLSVSVTCAGAVCVDQGQFVVSGTGSITDIYIGTTHLLTVGGLTLGGSESLIAFCGRVAADINNNTSAGRSSGFVAASNPQSPMVYISRATAASGDTASINLTITSTLTCTQTTAAMQASISPASATVQKTSQKINAVVSVIGGVAPYKYAWTFVSSTLGSFAGFSYVPYVTSAVVFQVNAVGFFSGKTFSEVWVCQVTDGSATPVVINSAPIILQYSPA
jgi:hypothetical protein